MPPLFKSPLLYGLRFGQCQCVRHRPGAQVLGLRINKTDVVSEAESITSEKCLLYVAMTRAQKGVYITSYGRPSEFLG